MTTESGGRESLKWGMTGAPEPIPAACTMPIRDGSTERTYCEADVGSAAFRKTDARRGSRQLVELALIRPERCGPQHTGRRDRRIGVRCKEVLARRQAGETRPAGDRRSKHP